jgi:DNA polymerase-3 subunit epsilon
MTAWWTGNCVPYDLETDGKEPDDARIIQWCVGVIGGKAHLPAEGPLSWSGLVKPERPIPDEAAGVHGISTEQAAAEGEDRVKAVQAIALHLANKVGGDAPVVGHNLVYDFTVLDREMRRLGIGSLAVEDNEFARLGQINVRVDGRQVGSFWAIDTMILDKAVDPFRPGPRGSDGEKLGGGRKLTYVTELYGVPIRGAAHDASADAFGAARLAFKLAQRADAAADYVACNGSDPMAFRTHPFMRWYAGRRDPLEIVKAFAHMGSLDLPNLHQWQTVQAERQAQGLREWFTKSGEGDPDTVSGEWPLRTIGESEAPA